MRNGDVTINLVVLTQQQSDELVGAIKGLMTNGTMCGFGSPANRIKADPGKVYVQLDSPGALWTKHDSGTKGWAISS